MGFFKESMTQKFVEVHCGQLETLHGVEVEWLSNEFVKLSSMKQLSTKKGLTM